MQILEASVLGLRAARHRLTSPSSSISVTLFPMVHIGDQSFFDRVYADAFSHDVVLVEGVRSPVVRLLTASYRWIENSELGLVVQPSYPPSESVDARIIQADLSDEEFHKEWQNVPIWLQLATYIGAPAIGLQRRFFASRVSISSKLGMEDKLSRDEILSWDPNFEVFQQCFLGARDARLVDHLRSQLDEAPSRNHRLAIVFGAGHMRAVLAELSRRNFFSVECDWQTAISF